MDIRFSPESLMQLTNAVRQAGVAGQKSQQSPGQQLPTGTPLGQQGLTPAGPLPPFPATGSFTLQAMVIAADGQGHMTLSLQNGLTLTVQGNPPLLVGSQVMLGVKPGGEVQVLNILLPAADAKASLLSRLVVQWDGLDTAITRLQNTNPAAVPQVLKALPSLVQGLLPGFVQFMNAVKGANLEDLFSKDALEALRSVGMEGPLRQDVQHMHALHQKAQEDATWRSFIFPYIEDAQDQHPKQGSFYWRGEPSDEGGSHRFVMNMSLSALGAVQLDGLVKGKTLYLKVRTLQDLGPDLAAGIEDITHKTLEMLGWQGVTKVEKTHTFTVDPLHEMTQTRHTFEVKV